ASANTRSLSMICASRYAQPSNNRRLKGLAATSPPHLFTRSNIGDAQKHIPPRSLTNSLRRGRGRGAGRSFRTFPALLLRAVLHLLLFGHRAELDGFRFERAVL